GGTDLERSVVAVWDRGEGGIHLDPQARALEAEAVAEGLGAPFRGLCARLHGWNVSVMVSPLDPRLPQLIRLSNPRHVAAMLAGPLSQASAAGYRIRTIRYRPGERHVLRYEPSPAPGAPTRAVFAKLSRREAGERAHLRSPPADRGRDHRHARTRTLRLRAPPPRGTGVHPRGLQIRPLVGLGRRSHGARFWVVRDRRPRPRCREVPRRPAVVVFSLRPGIRERAGGVSRVVPCGGSEAATGPRLRGAVPRRARGASCAAVPPRLGRAHRTSGAAGGGAARRATLSPPA